MGLLDKVKGIFAGGGGKRPAYRTHTEDGQEILIDSQEAVIGNNEATSFFTDLCGGSLKDIMLNAGATNPSMTGGDAAPGAPAAGVGGADKAKLDAFRKYGVRVSEKSQIPIYAKPGTYPHVDLDRGNVREAPADGGPLVISSKDDRSVAKNHATVVLSVFDTRRQGRQKQVTVHFHGRGVIRAKGFMRDIGAMGRPVHYDGAEVEKLLRQKARNWLKKIHWCTGSERY